MSVVGMGHTLRVGVSRVPCAETYRREGLGLTRGRVLLEGVIDQREVQHSWGVRVVWVGEAEAFWGLALLLRTGGHRRERYALLLAEPAQELQLLQGGQKWCQSVVSQHWAI